MILVAFCCDWHRGSRGEKDDDLQAREGAEKAAMAYDAGDASQG